MITYRSLFVLKCILSLLYLSRDTLAASGEGSVSLWSDSACGGDDSTLTFSEPALISLNYTLAADTCHDLDRAAHSYEVTQRPVCDNGIVADFIYYDDKGCPSKDLGPAFNQTPSGEHPYDGLCLALIEFNSFAFICEGIDAQQAPTSAAASASHPSQTVGSTEAPAVPFATPITPSSSRTTPLYTVPGSAAPSGTGVASGQPFPTMSLVPLAPSPSPSPFLGEASSFRVSGMSLCALVVAGLLL